MTTQTVTYAGDNADQLEAYFAQPVGSGPFPGVVVIHHLPGWDEWTTEVVRKLAHHGYAAVSPHLYSRKDMSAAAARADAYLGLREGRPVMGQTDDQAMGDIDASVSWRKARSSSNGRVGCIGFCSGGRKCSRSTPSISTRRSLPRLDEVGTCARRPAAKRPVFAQQSQIVTST
jgi:carboxymethylenebutenolidase